MECMVSESARVARANLERLGEAELLTPMAMWVAERILDGGHGNVMCVDCNVMKEGRDQIGHCRGCPKAWRGDADGENVEFWDAAEFS